MAKTEIPMTHPDGRPWVAESESEAFQLMSAGYTRTDGGKQTPPAAATKADSKST